MKIEVARLESLFAALRGAGLVVGVEEMARCRQVLALWGGDGEQDFNGRRKLDGPPVERWRSLLASVFVKAPAQRPPFEQAFELWAERAVVERFDPPAAVPLPQFRQGLVLALVVVFMLAWVLPYLAPRPFSTIEAWRPPTPKPSEDELKPSKRPTPDDDVPAAQPKVQVWLSVLPRKPEVPWPGWNEMLLGLLLLAWAGKVAADVEVRPLLPEPASPPPMEGPTQAFLSKVVIEPILEPEEKNAIVWSVGRFVSDEPTARIDLSATVRATAKAAGQLDLRFEPRSRHREIWLWLDEAAAEPQLRRVADELEQVLRRYGLPFERAYFRGVPEVLFSADGRRFRPREIEERRGDALVAILSDGRLLGRRLEGLDSLSLERTFRELGGWPRLALFLPDSAPGEVRSLAGRHQIAVRRPAELVSFLSPAKPRDREGGRDLELWAAACALLPTSIDEGSADALRRDLDFEASPWQISELGTRAGAEEVLRGRLQWRGEERRKRVEWLREVELGEERIYDHALQHWIERYDRDLKSRSEDSVFAGTLAEAQLRAERALLLLLKRGRVGAGARGAAIEELYRLHRSGSALQAYIEKKLAEMDTAGGSPSHLRLDFEWGELSAAQQHQLTKMGFAGRQAESRLHGPRRSASFLAMSLGLAAGAFLMALWPRGEEILEKVEVVNRLVSKDLGLVQSEDLQFIKLLQAGKEIRVWKVSPGARIALEGGAIVGDKPKLALLAADYRAAGARRSSPFDRWALDIANLFQDQEGKAFSQVTTKVLDQRADIYAMNAGLNWLNSETRDESSIRLFYISAFSEEEPGSEDKFNNLELDFALYFLLDRLRESSKTSILILDTCFAADGRDSNRNAIEDLRRFSSSNLISFSSTQLSNCRENSRGFITQALFEGLQDFKADGYGGWPRDGIIEVGELGEFLREEIMRTSKGRQRPSYMAPAGLSSVQLFKRQP